MPQLGVSNNYIYFAVNLYNDASFSTFRHAALYAYNKQQMLSCQSADGYTWGDLRNADGTLAFNLAPSVSITPPAATHYAVSSRQGGGCSLSLWTVDETTPPALSVRNVNTLCYVPPPAAGQQGSSANLDLGDNRIHGSVFYNGRLETALHGRWDWGNGNVNSVVWWFRLDPANGSLLQQGGFGNTGIWYFFPAMQQDSAGNSIFVFGISGAAYFPSLWVLGVDPTGSLNPTVALKWGEGPYGTSGSVRWGDYFSASLDPNNTARVWVGGEYATGDSSKWGTWIGEASY